MNIERIRKLECLGANCGFTKERCLIHHGSNCIKLGGKRIPLQTATPNQRVTFNVEAQATSGMKPYWIIDGKSFDEGREF